MPTNGNEQLNSEVAVWGVIPGVSGNNGAVTVHVKNTNASMGDRRKEPGLNGIQLTARLQSHYGVNDGHVQRRAISARYPRRGDDTNHLDVKYAWTVDKDNDKVSRAAAARSRGFPETSEIEAVRMYNMTNQRNSPRKHRQGNVRPKTALGFGDTFDQSLGGPHSRNSPFQASQPGFDIDPNIPITSNWDGVKDLNEDKVYDLYRRYLGIEYTPPPRIKSDDTEKENADAGEDGDHAEQSDERRDSIDNSDNTSLTVTTNGDLATVNATTERKLSEARSDISAVDRESQSAENEELQIKVKPPEEKRLNLDFPVSLKAVSKVKKSVSKFRRGGKKPETTPAPENRSSLQLPQLVDGLHDRRQSQSPAPTLKVKCSAEFQTAMEGLKIS